MVLNLLYGMQIPVKAAIVSGVCGDNVTWEFNQNTGLLTISGTGDMYDYTDDEVAPWQYFYVYDIFISEGITKIGDYAFYNLTEASLSTIPNSVKIIGDYSLNNTLLTSDIVIPEGVTSIGEAAFADSYDLESVTIPKSVMNIGLAMKRLY